MLVADSTTLGVFMLILQIYKKIRQDCLLYDDTWFITEMIDDVLTDILADESSPQSPARHLVLGVEAAHSHPFLVG